MKTKSRISRRNFLKGSAGLALAFQIVPSRILGMGGIAPSQMINMAVIGNGLISEGHRKYFAGAAQTRVLTVCDVHRGRLEAARAQVDEITKNRKDVGFKPADACADFHEIIARDDIDAVAICTPDHWHVAIALKAVEAGKAVYVEKPMSLTIEEGRILADAVKKNGTVLQVGSQQRSEWAFRRAAELVRNGYLGTVSTIETSIGAFPPEPKDLKEEPIPDGFDYDMWLGQTPWRPYNSFRVLGHYGKGWRCFYEYGARKEGDWGAHHFDIIQWALGMDDSGPVDFYPENSDGSKFRHYRYKDGPTVFVNAPIKNSHMIHFVGDEGELWVSRGGRIESNPPRLASLALSSKDVRLQVSNDHRKDFIDAIRFGKTNICTAEIGHRSATVCHLMSMARRLKAHVAWDPKAERVTNNAAAAAMVSRARRSPYFLGA